MSTELVVVEKTDIPTVFEAGGTDALVKSIKDQVKNIVGDTSTLKGRKEIASLAMRVAKSKTYLDGLGKNYVGELKAIPKAVDAERKRMRDTLDVLKDEVRKPLNEWEATEAERVEKHEADIAEINGGGDRATLEWMSLPLDCMQDRLKEIQSIVIGDSWDEYELDAAKAKENAIDSLEAAIDKRQKHDAEQAELAHLRQLAAEQAQKDKDEALRREGEERAKLEAEELAKALEITMALEAQKAEEAVMAAEIATRNAELRAVQATETAKAQAEAAALAERDRIELEQKVEREDAERRERNTQHKGKINRAVVACLVEHAKLTEAQGQDAVKAIAKGLVSFAEIKY